MPAVGDGRRYAPAPMPAPVTICRSCTALRASASPGSLWRAEQTDPEPFYTVLRTPPTSTGASARSPGSASPTRCGPGFYTRAFAAAGADVVPVDNSEDEPRLAARAEGYVLAHAGDLPFEDASFDGVFCSNLLEHTPTCCGAEISRVLRARRLGLHLLDEPVLPLGWGMEHVALPLPRPRARAEDLRAPGHGQPRKNPYGDGLWAVHVGPHGCVGARRPDVYYRARDRRHRAGACGSSSTSRACARSRPGTA